MKIFRKIRNQFDKEMRAYYKMRRKHRKELIKLAKEDRDVDWMYLHALVMTKIRHMHEYFSSGNNVTECEGTPKIIAELKHVLDLQSKIENMWHEQAGRGCNIIIEREPILYKEIYTYIGEHLQGWWD